MSRPARCKQTTPGSVGTRFCDPVFIDPIKKSPCQNRPDTGRPCPLLKHPKDNQICDVCGLLNKGRHIHTESEIKEIIAKGDLKIELRGSWRWNNVPTERCKWPTENCLADATRGSDYCERHNQALRYRKKRGWPDDELFRPIMVR